MIIERRREIEVVAVIGSSTIISQFGYALRLTWDETFTAEMSVLRANDVEYVFRYVAYREARWDNETDPKKARFDRVIDLRVGQ